ncbi:MAG TPA: hypothetical protein VNH18_28745 [Bryobacteraceae bacterium]|nr:hypothetical protein [Bryobacteraceae bacterium]
MAKSVQEVWVGTRKGAFVFRSKDRRKWEVDGPHFPGLEVHHVVQDPRDPQRLYAAVNSPWFGPHLHASTDGGLTWAQSEKGLEVTGIPNASLTRIWHIAPGAADDPNAVWLGADPGVLFRSEDNGASWKMVKGLSQHPTRAQWNPGAGGMMVHSIQPLGKGRVIVGISAAGAFRSSDGGKKWEAFNKNVLADFAPVKFPEVGQCVHKLLAHPRLTNDLYQQNHCGVYRSKFTGKQWTDISEGLPSRFGFALAVPSAEDQTIFTIPIGSAEKRWAAEDSLRVARSRDAGKTWEYLTKGLPQKNCFELVVREAMASDHHDEAGVYFGTQAGTVYYTRNAGKSWDSLAKHLPPVYSVTTAVKA